MNIDEIQVRYNNLNRDLRQALASMEKKDSVYVIKDQIRELQRLCPHNDSIHDFSKERECPYCGKRF